MNKEPPRAGPHGVCRARYQRLGVVCGIMRSWHGPPLCNCSFPPFSFPSLQQMPCFPPRKGVRGRASAPIAPGERYAWSKSSVNAPELLLDPPIVASGDAIDSFSLESLLPRSCACQDRALVDPQSREARGSVGRFVGKVNRLRARILGSVLCKLYIYLLASGFQIGDRKLRHYLS
ncbi:hypothetical protein F5Y15DRAFT_391681 [Xylariaceae sp. FL0016]|nr:hypothetical protein F5Y15DRAFT_391681 [Xylariaceae sp. FL0016]